MVNLGFYYDASEIFEDGHTTLLNIVLDICNRTGIALATTDFRGNNKQISWYDNTRTAREYIGYAAELNGGYAQIRDNKLYFIKQKTESVKTIHIDDCESFEIGDRRKISKVVYDLGTLVYSFGDDSADTLYLNTDNVFITGEDDVRGIYEDIVGFEFYNFTTSNCPIDFNIKAGEIITFTDGINEYPTIANYDNLTYSGEWQGGYSLQVESSKQSETQTNSVSQRIKNLQIVVDRDANKITQVVEEVSEQNQKISQVSQEVGELNSKISDIADITTMQESIFARLEFEKINESEPIYIKIRPTTTNISYLYPHEGLYPSDDLFMPDRILRFTNTETEEVVDYELPDDLLVSEDSYDEFILDYDQQTCFVNKRVGYNADGTTYTLNTQRIVEYEYPQIALTDGDYTIELVGYNEAYIQVRLMSQNIYTSQFATKVEVKSEISQTADSIKESVEKSFATKGELQTEKAERIQTSSQIEQSVSRKVGNDEIISRINQTPEQIKINADKVSLERKNNRLNE